MILLSLTIEYLIYLVNVWVRNTQVQNNIYQFLKILCHLYIQLSSVNNNKMIVQVESTNIIIYSVTKNLN